MKRMLLLSIIAVLGMCAIGFACTTVVDWPPVETLPNCNGNQCIDFWEYKFYYLCDDPEACSAPTPDCGFVDVGHATDLDWIRYEAVGSCSQGPQNCGTGDLLGSEYFEDECQCS